MCANDKGPLWDQLRLLSIRLRSIGHLIETQDPDAPKPDDILEVNWGLSMLIYDLSSKVRKHARRLEMEEMKAENTPSPK
jgi:hypothetical protein